MAHLGHTVGFWLAERIVVCLSVLVFFWGSFALVTAASQRPPWLLVPAFWMFAYGWTFQMGFLNYYLSLGLAFLAMGLFWRGKQWDYGVVAILAVSSFWLIPSASCGLQGVWFISASRAAYIPGCEIFCSFCATRRISAAFLCRTSLQGSQFRGMAFLPFHWSRSTSLVQLPVPRCSTTDGVGSRRPGHARGKVCGSTSRPAID